MERLGTCDVAVIGGGVVGGSAAYFAANMGASVALIEKGLPGQEASGRNGGGVRQQGRLAAELPLAMHSVRLWRHFRDDLGGQFEYVQDGNLYLAQTEAEVEILKRTAVRQQQQGLPVQYLDAPSLRDMAPALSPAIRGANYCATDGQANPILATRWVVRAAMQQGATVHVRTRATGIEVDGGHVTAVLTDRGRIECRAVIVAAGAWAVDLLRPLGVDLPLLARRTSVCITTKLPQMLHQFISGNTIYMRQTVAGNVLIGGGGPWEPLGFRKDTTAASLHRFAARGADLLPALRQTSILRTWAGTLDMSPDGSPLIGTVPSIAGLVLAVGFTGHGFCLGPGAGDATARLALGQPAGVDISHLAVDRFPPGFDYAREYKAEAEPAP